jgi:hypothetical protein
MKKVAEPFIISTEVAQPFLKADTTFKIGRNLNQSEANQLADRVNFSTKDYTFEVISST